MSAQICVATCAESFTVNDKLVANERVGKCSTLINISISTVDHNSTDFKSLVSILIRLSINQDGKKFELFIVTCERPTLEREYCFLIFPEEYAVHVLLIDYLSSS